MDATSYASDQLKANDMHIITAASYAVDEILVQATSIVTKFGRANIHNSLQMIVFSPQDYDTHNINQTAIKGISNFIDHWSLTSRKWKYVVKPFQQWKNEVEGGEVRETFVFQAVFSVPRRRSPVPQATVNVYFVFDIDEREMQSCTDDPVCVTFNYQFEGMTYLHEANSKRVHFQDGILGQIIDSKLEMYRQLDF